MSGAPSPTPSQGSWAYDSDASGDISLSLPASSSTPRLSSLLNPDYSVAEASSSIGRTRSMREHGNGTTDPGGSPQKLFGRGLWNKTQSFPENERDTSAVGLGLGGRKGANEVSLNDEPEAGPSTRSRVISFPETPSRTRRPPQPLDLDLLTPTAQSNPPSITRHTSAHSPTRTSRRVSERLASVDLTNDRAASSSLSANNDSHDRARASTPTGRLGWSRRAGDPRPPPLVSEEVSRRMSRWVKEVVVCNFDLETGPMVERRAGSRRWGPGEKENVAFSAFPDTSLFAEGSIIFSFKIRHIPPDPVTLAMPEPPSPMPGRSPSVGSISVPTVEQSLLNLSLNEADAAGAAPQGLGPPRMSEEAKAQEYRRWDERGREWLFGYVWFEQRKDKGIKRGYMQKSLVILTHLPFPSLFSAVLEKVAPTFFTQGYSALEKACHSIASWPDPSSSDVLELPIMTETLKVKLPDDAETSQIGRAFTQSPLYPILPSLPGSTPLRAFHHFLPALWSLWECLILAEPILIVTPDPRTCSEIVWWLRDLLRPVPAAGDFRPYLHIHDHDLTILINANKPQPGAVIGVTNPYFRNAAGHWPNVISIPTPRPKRNLATAPPPSTTAGLKADAPDGFLSRRHRSVQKDRVLLKRLEDLAADGLLDDPAGNEALRAHFQQLTEKFLVPLNRYFQTLVPTLSSPNPSTEPAGSSFETARPPAPPGRPLLKPFSLPAFLEHLRTRGPNPLAFKQRGLSTKARVEHDFYASFCMSANFSGWLARRMESMGMAFAAQRESQRRGSQASSVSAAPALAGPSGLDQSRSQSQSPARVPLMGHVTRPSDDVFGHGDGKSAVRVPNGADTAHDQYSKQSSEDDRSAVAPNGRTRQSEDSPREKEVGVEGYFGRRSSLGNVGGTLTQMTPKR